ncbi:hypothetical protein O7623_00015 [Solwaraspora sp. WMMD791]|uniref:hypothetical protein n=1 Tax=Solwaraspora sp. WMMD791 TaxID=3016086 RepID=UPI002499DD53|nr:hypothetical protein [Solwaraspora sp. WMMD791]WFE27634.1 hypothetical protein O7623_31250 [Solwaraspora sp. WMMD791]WFE27647.1 hypothetical protein O7623_00015 [Solwaraspora sp. WMMD791]
MNPDDLFDLAADFAQATGNAERFRTCAATSTGDDHTTNTRKASRWEAVAARRREHLRTALREALHGTVTAVPDAELPVATWQQRLVEIRAITLDNTRAVRVRYTPTQALTTGADLIACAAVTDEHSGGILAGILPAFPPRPSTDNEPAGEEETGGMTSRIEPSEDANGDGQHTSSLTHP